MKRSLHRCPAHMAIARSAAIAGPLSIVLSGGSPAAAQNIEDVTPPQLSPPVGAAPATAAPSLPAPTSASEQILLPELRGLAFVAGADGMRQGDELRPGLSVDPNLRPLDATFAAEVSPYIGQPLSAARLSQITQAVVKAFRRADRPAVDAVAIEQDVSKGIVQIVVIEFKAGDVRVEGNRWFSSKAIRSALRVRDGESIAGSRVAEDIAILNENPFRTVEAIYERGAEPGRTNILLRTRDRLPLRVYAGLDDAGIPSLGVNRLFAGVSYGNLFGADHEISYQYTSSTNVFNDTPKELVRRSSGPRFYAHSLTYTAPMPWRDRLNISFLYARSNPFLAAPFTQQGSTTQISFRYAFRLPRTEASGQELRLGYDFKRSNNNLAFGGFTVNDGFTEIHQLAAEYAATVLDRLGSTSATLIAVGSPGGISAQNSREAFSAARLGASAKYAYTQLILERRFKIETGATLLLRATGQLATGPLLSSEQLGLGGANSVRGYDTFTASGDEGLIIGAELRAPAQRLLKGRIFDRFEPLVFAEGGRVYSRTPQNNQRQRTELGSAGIGFRYNLDRYLDLRFDYAVQLRGSPTARPALGRGHLSLTASW